MPVLSRDSYEKKLQALVPVVLRFLKVRRSTISVSLLSDARMRFLEKKYMHKQKKIVNVLSFKNPEGFPHPESRDRFLGDVFINWDIHQKNPLQMDFLLIHGILHILGYRHGVRRDIITMHNLELRICRHISLPESILERQPHERLLRNAGRRVN